MFCLKYIWADRKAYRLEISGADLRFVVIYMGLVRTQTGMKILVSVQQPTRSQTGLSCLLSGRSHVNAKKKCMAAVAVSCKYPLRYQTFLFHAGFSPRYKLRTFHFL